MPRTLYSPRLSDDVVRRLYVEGQRRRMPMTQLADQLIREALAASPAPSVCPEPIRAAPHLRVVA
jgi:hypothetical protein